MAKQSTGKAGWYWQRATRYVRSAGSPGSTGHKRPTFAVGDTFWCWTQDAKPHVQLAYGVMNKMIDIEIHIRGYPDLDLLDCLLDVTSGRYCQIKAIKYDYTNGETVAIGIHVPTLEATE